MKPIGYTATLDLFEFLFVYMIILIPYFIKIKWISKKITMKSWTNFCIWLFYWLSLIKVVFFPISYRFIKNPQLTSELFYQFSPFKTISHSIENGLWIQIVGNIVLLLPIPILLTILQKSHTYFYKILIIGLSLSLSIELIQLLIDHVTKYPNKVVDVDDVILNVSGVILGWIISKVYLLLNSKD